MPGRLISHNFLIVGSSQVQQMLLLPPLLNKVGREERHLSIVFFHWNQNKHCVYAVLSNRKPCAKSSFCVTQKTDKNLPLYFYHYANDLPPPPLYWGYITVIAIQTCWLGFLLFLVLANIWFWTWHLLGCFYFFHILILPHLAEQKPEGFHWNKQILCKYF